MLKLTRAGEHTLAILPVFAIGLLLVVIPWFDGGNGWQAEAFLFILTLPIFYFTYKGRAGVLWGEAGRSVSVVFGLFLIFCFLSLIPSADRFYTFDACLRYASYYLVFLSLLGTPNLKDNQTIPYAAIVSVLVLAVIGLYQFFASPNFGYTHLYPLFYQKNAFGGFLMIPIFFSLAYTLSAQEKWLRRACGASFTFLTAIFILTFSRGSWLSLGLGAIATLLLGRTHVTKVIRTEWRACVALVAGVGLLVAGALFITHVEAARSGQAVAIWSGETLESNTVTARLHYFKDAFIVIAHNVLLGVGLTHYGEAVKLYKNTPAYYAASPHNAYLQFTAETGIVGGILFAVFILLVLLYIWRCRKTESLFFIALSAGFIAIALHSGMEIDWTYNGNALLYMVAAGLIMSDSKSTHEAKHGHVLFIFLTLIAFVLLMWGLQTTYTGLWSDRGYQNAGAGNLGESAIDFVNASKPLAWNPTPHFNAAVVLMNLAATSTDPSVARGYLDASLKEIDAALAAKPEKPLFYSYKAEIYRELGNTEAAEQAYADTIRYNPVEGIYEYAQLAQLYDHDKRYSDVIAFAPRALSYYPPSLYDNPYWVNPDKPGIWADVSDLYTALGVAYLNTHQPDNAHAAFTNAVAYNPQNVEAQALVKLEFGQ